MAPFSRVACPVTLGVPRTGAGRGAAHKQAGGAAERSLKVRRRSSLLRGGSRGVVLAMG